MNVYIWNRDQVKVRYTCVLVRLNIAKICLPKVSIIIKLLKNMFFIVTLVFWVHRPHGHNFRSTHVSDVKYAYRHNTICEAVSATRHRNCRYAVPYWLVSIGAACRPTMAFRMHVRLKIWNLPKPEARRPMRGTLVTHLTFQTISSEPVLQNGTAIASELEGCWNVHWACRKLRDFI